MGQLNIFTDHSSRSWEVQVQSAGRFGLESRSFSFQIKSKQNRTKNPDTFCQQKSTFWSLPLLQRTLILSWEPHPHDLQENWIPNKDLCEWGWIWGKIRVNTLTHICAWTAGSNAWLLRLLFSWLRLPFAATFLHTYHIWAVRLPVPPIWPL